MSGGRFDYDNDRACNSMFDYTVTPDYGLGEGDKYKRSVRVARKNNPMKDTMISELVFDVFCLIHSADWYLSADTGEETYKKDLDYFKRKWLGTPVNDIVEREIDRALDDVREELKRTLLWEADNAGA